MDLKKIPLILIVTVSGWLLSGLAVNAIDVTPTSSNAQTQAVSIPDPLSLKPQWWSYFIADSKELEQRVDRFLEKLTRYQKSAESAGREDFKELIERIHTNATILKYIKDREADDSFPIFDRKSSYTISELGALNKLKSQQELNKTILTSRLFETRQSIKLAQRYVDDLFTQYQKIENHDESKLLSGLQVIDKRISLIAHEVQLPILESRAQHQDQVITKINKEIEHGIDHLSVSEEEHAQIQQNIQRIGEPIPTLKQAVAQSEADALCELGEDSTSLTKRQYLDLKIVQQELKLFEELANQTQLNATQGLVSTVLNKPHQSAKTAAKFLIAQRESLEQLILQRDSIFAKANREACGSENVFRGITNQISRISQANDPDQQRQELVAIVLQNLQQASEKLENIGFINYVHDKLLTKKYGFIYTFRINEGWTTGLVLKRIKNILNWKLFSINDQTVTLFNALVAVLVFFIVLIIASIVRKFINQLRISTENRSLTYTLSRLLYYGIIFVGFFIALSIIGINFTNLAIIAGALSVGIGFGLQAIANNFISGIIVLFERSIKVGDFIEFESGLKGTVKEISVRSTLINTLDNLDIIVPNSELVTSKVTNYTLAEPFIRIHVPFCAAYDTDKKLVEKAGLEAACKVDFTYDDGAQRRPQVWLVGLGELGLNFELVTWINANGVSKPGAAQAIYYWEIESALKRHSIEIPTRPRNLHVKSGGAAHVPSAATSGAG